MLVITFGETESFTTFGGEDSHFNELTGDAAFEVTFSGDLCPFKSAEGEGDIDLCRDGGDVDFCWGGEMCMGGLDIFDFVLMPVSVLSANVGGDFDFDLPWVIFSVLGWDLGEVLLVALRTRVGGTMVGENACPSPPSEELWTLSGEVDLDLGECTFSCSFPITFEPSLHPKEVIELMYFLAFWAKGEGTLSIILSFLGPSFMVLGDCCCFGEDPSFGELVRDFGSF